MKDLMKEMLMKAKDMGNFEDQLTMKYPSLKEGVKASSIGPFGACHNNLILCIEMMDSWLQYWDNPERMQKILGKSTKDLTEVELSQLRKENFERVMGLLKWSLFLPTFSMIEFSMKNVLLLLSDHPAAEKINRLKNTPYKISFNHSILQPARLSGLLTDDQGIEWKILAQLRNSIVHNNAIAQSDQIYKGKNYEINFKIGKMLWSKLNTFFYCSLALIELYFTWVDNLLESANL